MAQQDQTANTPLKSPTKKIPWKNVAIGCGIALIIGICFIAVGIIIYIERDNIPGLDDLFSGVSPAAPDQIAFTSYQNGEGDIYIISLDGSGETRLTTDLSNDTDAEWSPDGKRIVFTSSRDGNNNIFIMNADGSSEIRLTDTPGDDASPAFSPDGTKIAFLSDRNGNYEIFTMAPDGTNPRAVTNSAYATDLDPVWSPDGNQILFASGVDVEINLWRINVDGTNLTQLTFGDSISWFPTWCHSTDLVAFETNAFGDSFSDFDIVTMRPNGNDQNRITFTTSNDSFPECSPDGKKLAFVSNMDGNFEIYIVNIDGSSITRLTNNTIDDGAPAWKP